MTPINALHFWWNLLHQIVGYEKENKNRALLCQNRITKEGDIMANRQKYTRAAIGHMCKHYERGLDSKGELVKYHNQDIHTELSHLNYNLAEHDQPLPQLEFIQKRISALRCLNRKNVNVMISWVVTLPKEMNDKSDEEKRKFFERTYEFLKKRYGVENVISAYVHLDETQPHMHFAFTPVMYDTKKGRYKFDAKVVGSRKDLRTFHTDLDVYLERELGYRTGVINGVTELNLSIQELKRMQKEMADLDKKLDDIQLETLNKTFAGNYKASDVDSILEQNRLLKQKEVLQNQQLKVLEDTKNILQNELKRKKFMKIDGLEDEVTELRFENDELNELNNNLTIENAALKTKNKELELSNGKLSQSLKTTSNREAIWLKTLIKVLAHIDQRLRHQLVSGLPLPMKQTLESKVEERLKFEKNKGMRIR